MNTTRRAFLQTVAAATAGTIVSSAARAQEAAFGRVLGLDKQTGNKRPNIIYIHSHDTGRFTSPYGYQVPTPNLQRLAADGICFTQAHSVAPTCSPARAGLLTGQFAHSCGMLGLARGMGEQGPGFGLNDYKKHILHTLRREAGYCSALVGLQHIADDPSVIGFDHIEKTASLRADDVAPAAVRFLRNRPSQPFWLEIGFGETHRPFHKTWRTPVQDGDPRYLHPPEFVPNADVARQDMAEFCGCLRKLDEGIGEVLAALEAEGLAQTTLVISTTDHGISFPGGKCTLYDSGTGVHFVMRGPGGFNGGKTCNALISQVDLFPTICDLLEIKRPDWLVGKSFLPVIREEKREINEAIFAEVNFHAAYEPLRGVRTKKWKYIRRFGDYRHPVVVNCDPGLTKTLWVDGGWAAQVLPSEELFDLTFDPNERNNLVADSSFNAVLEDMRQRLTAWMESTSDPLRSGPLRAPHGVRMAPREAIDMAIADRPRSP